MLNFKGLWNEGCKLQNETNAFNKKYWKEQVIAVIGFYGILIGGVIVAGKISEYSEHKRLEKEKEKPNESCVYEAEFETL